MNELTGQIEGAQRDLLITVAKQPDRWWDARDLREEAKNGWSGDVMMFALTDLVNQGKLSIDPQLRVKHKQGLAA